MGREACHHGLLKSRFVSFLGPVMTGTLAFSTPTFAQDSAASSNAADRNANVSAPEATGKELCLEWKEKARDYFPIICAMNTASHVVQDVVEDGSTRRFLIAAWGGLDEHRKAVIDVARDMYISGRDIGVVFGPDQDTHMISEWAKPTSLEVTVAFERRGFLSYADFGWNQNTAPFPLAVM